MSFRRNDKLPWVHRIAIFSTLLCVTLIHSLECHAQVATRQLESTAAEMVLPVTQQAIDRGLQFLANSQTDDGAIGSGTNYRKNAAVTSLAGMAFLSAGHVPGRGKYGRQVERSVDFILSCSKPSGFIIYEGSHGHGPMYGHGFATLFLAEVYGMSPRHDGTDNHHDRLKDRLKSAVQLIINSQNREGGWRYEPDGKDADISVTVCQMMALRAARNCGIAVPKSTVDLCVEYVKACQNTDGGFRYQRAMRSQSEFPRSAAGVVTLYSAGLSDTREIERGLGYLLRFQPRGEIFRYDSHYFYGQYYAVQAMWHAGDERWQQWYPAIRDELTLTQLPDGSWNDQRTVSFEYATAMACLVLQMPNNYLPIFQR